MVEPWRARRRAPLRPGGGAHAARVVVPLVPAPVARLEPPGVIEGRGPVWRGTFRSSFGHLDIREIREMMNLL